MGALVLLSTAQAQSGSERANYRLAARFAPKKLEKMIFSTAVDPHWLKHSDRFWYTYETPNGKNWYLVDPAKAEKKLMFDNARLAAELTKIVRDPMDAQNLLIDSLRFVKDENCKYRAIPIKEIKEMLGVQENLWKKKKN